MLCSDLRDECAHISGSRSGASIPTASFIELCYLGLEQRGMRMAVHHVSTCMSYKSRRTVHHYRGMPYHISSGPTCTSLKSVAKE